MTTLLTGVDVPLAHQMCELAASENFNETAWHDLTQTPGILYLIRQYARLQRIVNRYSGAHRHRLALLCLAWVLTGNGQQFASEFQAMYAEAEGVIAAFDSTPTMLDN